MTTLDLSIPTVHYHDHAPAPPDWDGVFVSLTTPPPGEASSLTLTVPEAVAVAAWLREAAELAPAEVEPSFLRWRGPWEDVLAGRERLLGERVEPGEELPECVVDLAAEQGGGPRIRLALPWHEAHALLLSPALARRLADALDAVPTALDAHPPRQLLDHAVGATLGRGTDGAEVTVGVAVETAVSTTDQGRITLDFLGTWWIDPEADALADALDAAASATTEATWLSLHEPRETEPWMVVSTVLADDATLHVRLRLTDELVAERGEDGVILLTPEAAAAFAALLREAIAWKAAHAPWIFVPPEPLGRTIARIEVGRAGEEEGE